MCNASSYGSNNATYLRFLKIYNNVLSKSSGGSLPAFRLRKPVGNNIAKAAAFGGQPNHALKRRGSVIHPFPPQKNGRHFDVRIWGGGSLPAFRLREPVGNNFAKAAAFGGQSNHALKRRGSVIHPFPPQKNGRRFDVRIWGGGSLPAFRLRKTVGSNFAKATASRIAEPRAKAPWFVNPPLPTTEKGTHFRVPFSVVGRGGFEPPKTWSADLQSAPFGRSGTFPCWSW